MNSMVLTKIRRAPKKRTGISWQFAYRFALGNALTFLCLSSLAYALNITSIAINSGIEIVFLVGSTTAFVLLARSGGALAALSYYVLGAGVFFGFGTFWATMSQDDFFVGNFSPETQLTMLPTLNLLNSVSVAIVLASGGLFSVRTSRSQNAYALLYEHLKPIMRVRSLIILIAVAVLLAHIATFPFIEDAILRNLLSRLDSIVLLAIVISTARWSESPAIARVVLVICIVVTVILGLLSMSKTTALLPLVALVSGVWLDARTRRLTGILTIAGIVGYFFVIAPVADFGRRDARYNPDTGTITERLEIVADTWNNLANFDSDNGLNHFFRRFSVAPFQAFLTKSYDEGRPGSSLADAGYALIPRVFWPGKPNITRFGGEFYLLYFASQESESSSALAPSYDAEAYWNYGWLGLIAVSTIIGLELGWFTRRWFNFINTGKHIGILFFAVPIILDAFWVETWTAATYVGGFVTLFILVEASTFAWPFALGLLRTGRYKMTAGWPLRARPFVPKAPVRSQNIRPNI